ncbi:MAG: polymer-forming cytoskeletal protein [Gemmatimonadetes bacterium]|nr:polymer-forming cytoskeletal protein [Gemmatimonadota bacterium]
MAMFGKDGPQRPEARAAAAPVEGALSIIAAGMTITGDIESSGVLKIDGEVNGSIRGARQVLLGRGGVVRGNVAGDEVVVGGAVEGSVTASERLELQTTASVTGDIDTKSIVVIEGAKINGQVRMNAGVASKSEPLRIARA